jgi:hypothetical protein
VVEEVSHGDAFKVQAPHLLIWEQGPDWGVQVSSAQAADGDRRHQRVDVERWVAEALVSLGVEAGDGLVDDQ